MRKEYEGERSFEERKVRGFIDSAINYILILSMIPSKSSYSKKKKTGTHQCRPGKVCTQEEKI